MLQVLYSILSERQLVEHIDYDLLFRWFVGMAFDEPIWNQYTFTTNRDRLLNAEIAHKLFEQIRAQAYAKHLLSPDHFSVDGALIDASASMKSFVLKPEFRENEDGDTGGNGSGRNGEVGFKKE